MFLKENGRKGKPVIFDMDPKPAVWNYAIHSYKMKFFNPVTNEMVESFKKAVVPLFNLEQTNKLLKNRAKQARYIIGVELTVDYADDDNPSLAEIDSEENDVINTKIIRYDLELDQKLNLIGGEYRSALRPDFAWIPKIEDGKTLLEDKKITSYESLIAKGGFTNLIKQLSDKSIPAPSVLQKLISTK
ncbi:hypothetical protein N9N67_11435 [Bacteriovoracaceae bacterium]|nr:hypothetical protein [Bacteriovoracaceae bacterium]